MRGSTRNSCVSLDISSSARTIARKVRQQAAKRRQETQRAIEHVAKEWLKDSPRTPSKRRRSRNSLPKISALPSPPATPTPSTRRPVKGICYMCGDIAPLAIVHDQDAVLSASKQKGKQVATTASSISGRSRSRSLESQLDRLQIPGVEEEEAEVDAILGEPQTPIVRSQALVPFTPEFPTPYSEAASVQWLGEPMDIDQSDTEMLFIDPQPTQYAETFVEFEQSPSKSARNRKARRSDLEDQPRQRSKPVRDASASPVKRRGRFDPFARVPSSGLGITQRLNSSDPFIAAFARYERGWKVLGDDGACVIQFDEIPWPVCSPPKSARDITVEEVETFYRLAKPPPDFKFLSVTPSKFREFVQRELETRWSWEMALKKIHSRTSTSALNFEASDAAINVRKALKNLLEDDEF